MADFTAVHSKLDVLKAEVDKVVAKLNMPPVEDPAIQAGIDAVASAIDDTTTKLTSVSG